MRVYFLGESEKTKLGFKNFKQYISIPYIVYLQHSLLGEHAQSMQKETQISILTQTHHCI